MNFVILLILGGKQFTNKVRYILSDMCTKRKVPLKSKRMKIYKEEEVIKRMESINKMHHSDNEKASPYFREMLTISVTNKTLI